MRHAIIQALARIVDLHISRGEAPDSVSRSSNNSSKGPGALHAAIVQASARSIGLVVLTDRCQMACLKEGERMGLGSAGPAMHPCAQGTPLHLALACTAGPTASVPAQQAQHAMQADKQAINRHPAKPACLHSGSHGQSAASRAAARAATHLRDCLRIEEGAGNVHGPARQVWI